jgi:hypothetical protein
MVPRQDGILPLAKDSLTLLPFLLTVTLQDHRASNSSKASKVNRPDRALLALAVLSSQALRLQPTSKQNRSLPELLRVLLPLPQRSNPLRRWLRNRPLLRFRLPSSNRVLLKALLRLLPRRLPQLARNLIASSPFFRYRALQLRRLHYRAWQEMLRLQQLFKAQLA